MPKKIAYKLFNSTIYPKKNKDLTLKVRLDHFSIHWATYTITFRFTKRYRKRVKRGIKDITGIDDTINP